MSIRQRSAATTIAVTLSLSVMAAPAFADAFNSTLQGVSAGFTSRTWGDNRTDSTPTTVKLVGCYNTWSGTFNHATLALNRQRGILPDEGLGYRDFYCTTSASKTWSSPVADVYYFHIADVNNSGSVAMSTDPSPYGVGVSW